MKSAPRISSYVKPDGLNVVTISADSKKEAQGAIMLCKAMARANGCTYKLVSFISTPSEYSNLVIYYRARFVYRPAA
jgi:hypothetical protein